MNRKTASVAIQVTRDLDRIAEVIRKQGSDMGLPADIVRDFAKKCANVSAIVNSEVSGRWDAKQIGEDRPVYRADPSPANDYVNEHFNTQNEFRELQELHGVSLKVASRYLRNR